MMNAILAEMEARSISFAATSRLSTLVLKPELRPWALNLPSFALRCGRYKHAKPAHRMLPKMSTTSELHVRIPALLSFTHTHTYTYTYTRRYIHSYVHACIHAHICTYICTILFPKITAERWASRSWKPATDRTPCLSTASRAPRHLSQACGLRHFMPLLGWLAVDNFSICLCGHCVDPSRQFHQTVRIVTDAAPSLCNQVKMMATSSGTVWMQFPSTLLESFQASYAV